MNKQELISRLTKLLEAPSEVEGSDFDNGHNYGIERAIILAEQLNEQQAQINKPEKPVVPQFVADWVANSREYDYEFCDFFDCNYQPEEVYRWLKCENRRQSELNSLALSMFVVHGRDAVIVEKEKLYTVEIPNPNAGGHVVLCKTSDGIVSITFVSMARWQGCKNFQLTEAEIKKDFYWAWKFRKEVEE